MDQVWGVVIGAAAALLGSVVTSLLAPWVSRVWQRSDKKISDAQAREALLRAAIEEYVNALWETDLAFSSAVHAKTPAATSEAAGQTLAAMQAIQRAEARVGLLLTGAESPIAGFMARVTRAVITRDRDYGNHTSQMTNLRGTVVAGFAAWLRGEKTPEQVLAEFEQFERLVWNPATDDSGEMGGGEPAR